MTPRVVYEPSPVRISEPRAKGNGSTQIISGIRLKEVSSRIDAGARNPLYRTSSTEIGLETMSSYHLPDVFYPKGNEFTKSFTTFANHSCGLVTSLSRNRVHD